MSETKEPLVFPSLSADGWIKDRNILVNKLFEMFMASDKSQSNFRDVQSLKYILNEEKLSTEERANMIKDSLEKLYRAYFEIVNVTVEVSVKDGIVDYGTRVYIIDNGLRFEVSKDISNVSYDEFTVKLDKYN